MRRKNSRNTYIIFALICLIVLNIGTILIKSMGNKAKVDPGYGVKPVFSYEQTNVKDKNFFTILLGRTSSMINLYRNQHLTKSSWKDYINKNFSLTNKFKNFISAQFPSIISFGKDLNVNNMDSLSEDDMEGNPKIVEDFIIIDRLEEYEDLIIINDSEGNISLENIPKPINIKTLNIDKNKPYILLYHTHGTESYSPIKDNRYHTTDRRYNVTTVGENMAKVLEGKGHKIEHVTEYHDIPSYKKSYSRSLNTVTRKLKENSNFKILLDVHRDGFDVDVSSNNKNVKKILAKTKTNIDGKEVATFCFVVGPDNPNKEAVLSFAKYIKAVTDSIYPGLCTGILIKPVGKYNQYLSDYSALIEIGSNLNTMDEAMETARILGEILSIVIEKIQG
jgi:stage II sporulation protein P